MTVLHFSAKARPNLDDIELIPFPSDFLLYCISIVDDDSWFNFCTAIVTLDGDLV